MHTAADSYCRSRAISAGVFPSISLTSGSAPAEIRFLTISSGGSLTAAKCNAFLCCLIFLFLGLNYVLVFFAQNT
jgi:hypothetical protein